MCGLEAELSPPVLAAAPDVHPERDAAREAYALLLATDPELVRPAEAELWIERAVTVLTANIASGRFACVRRHEQDNSLTLIRYARKVLGWLITEWERVERLRDGDNLGWTVVIRHMERQAYFWLGPTGREEWARSEAGEAAARTCADLWHWLQRNVFPFDVSFDHWAARALRNRLKDSVRSRRRQARVVVDSLDRPCFEDGRAPDGLLPIDDMSVWLELESRREVLRQAWTRLEQRQAHIIHRWYVEGWSVGEIAAETKLEVGHIYVLKHRALKKLREYCVNA